MARCELRLHSPPQHHEVTTLLNCRHLITLGLVKASASTSHFQCWSTKCWTVPSRSLLPGAQCGQTHVKLANTMAALSQPLINAVKEGYLRPWQGH
jgi:hypothetical protein